MSIVKAENWRNTVTNKKVALRGGNVRITTKTTIDQSKEKMNMKNAEPLVSADSMFEAKPHNLRENGNSQALKLDYLVNQIGGSINQAQFKLDQDLMNRYHVLASQIPSANQEVTKAALADFLQVRQVSIKNPNQATKAKNLTPKQGSPEERAERPKKQRVKEKKTLQSSSEYEGFKTEDDIGKRNSLDLTPAREMDINILSKGSKNSGKREGARKDSNKDSLPSLKDTGSTSSANGKKRRSGSQTPNHERSKNSSFDYGVQKSERRNASSLTPKKERLISNIKKEDTSGARFGPLEKIKEISAKKSPAYNVPPINQKPTGLQGKVSQTVMANSSNILANKNKTMSISNFPANSKPTLATNNSSLKAKGVGSITNENIEITNNTLTPRGENAGVRASSLGNSAVISVKFSPNQQFNKSQPFQQNRVVKPFNPGNSLNQTSSAAPANNILNAMLNPTQLAGQGIVSYLPNASAINLRQPAVIKVEEPKKKAVYVPPPQSNKLKYSLGGGNNSQLVKRVLAKRDWWEETESFNTLFSLKWQQTFRGYKYDRLNDKSGQRQLVNHFEFHPEVSTKDGLIRNMMNYCEANKITLFDCTPLTFLFDMDDEVNFDRDMQRFAKLFIKNHPDPNKYPHPTTGDRKGANVWFNFDYRKTGKYQHPNLNEDKKPSQYLKPIMANTFTKTASAWILKPVGFNRGRGIEVFNTLEALNEFINDWYLGNSKKKAVKEKKEEAHGSDGEDEAEDALTKELTVMSRAFVIQKYIEDPFLINKRKFDFRVWVLITHDMQLYFFKEGYLRMSSEEFSLDANQVCNKFIHLTNNAVQKYSNSYGQQESGNQLSFDDFDNYCKAHHPNADFRGKMLPRMKELVKHSMQSVGKILNQNDRKHCFEIFGYDFMIDAEYNTWLIEVNTNPCIEESSPLLGMLIPRMLDDAFKMTVDVIFPRPYRKQNTQNLRGNATEEKKKADFTSPIKDKLTLIEDKDKAEESKIANEVEKPEEEKPAATEEPAQKVEGDAVPSQTKEEMNKEEGTKAEKEVEPLQTVKFTSPTKNVKEEATENVFSVKGYPDNESMWEFLCALQTGPRSPNKRDKRN